MDCQYSFNTKKSALCVHAVSRLSDQRADSMTSYVILKGEEIGEESERKREKKRERKLPGKKSHNCQCCDGFVVPGAIQVEVQKDGPRTYLPGQRGQN